MYPKYKNINDKIIILKEKILNTIFRINNIEKNNEICGLLFNNKELSNIHFADYSYIISQSFSHIIIKFNEIKENDYFKKLMIKVLVKFTDYNLINAFDNFNKNILINYECTLFYLDLIIETLNQLKHLESTLNKKLFESLNYLTVICQNQYNKKLQFFNQNFFEKLLIKIIYLLLNTKGKFNIKENCHLFENLKIFLKIINDEYKIQLFIILFSGLFTFNLKNNENNNFLLNNINDIDYNFFSNLNIEKLNSDLFDYLNSFIKLFIDSDPEIKIINLLINYFSQIFHIFNNTFFSQYDNIINKKEILKRDYYFSLCSFFHIFTDKNIYYYFYLYLIKYAQTISDNIGIFELFIDLRPVLMNIYKLCFPPFYFQIIIELITDINNIQKNLIYIKELLDMILNIEYIEPNLIHEYKNHQSISNTLHLLKIFYFITKDKEICKNIFKYNLIEYFFKFFENLTKYKFIFSRYLMPIYIDDELEEKCIMEMIFNIMMSLIEENNDENIFKIFFDFFCENNEIKNNNIEGFKSIIFIFDLLNKSPLNNNNAIIESKDTINNIKSENYCSQDLEKYLSTKNYNKKEKYLLIEFLIFLQSMKLNNKEKNLNKDNNIDIIGNKVTFLDKFINMLIDDLLILINNISYIKKSKTDIIYDNFIDSILNLKAEDKIITKSILDNIDIAKNEKKNFNLKNNIKNINIYFTSFKCLLEHKCLLYEKNPFNDNIINIEKGKENIYSYFDIGNNNILCFKKDLLLKDFAIYFNDIFFYDKNFIKIKSSFYYNYKKFLTKEKLEYEYPSLNYPSKLKNFSSNKYALPKIFLTYDYKLYQNKYFNLLYPKIKQNLIKNRYPLFPSHYAYYSELLKNNIQPQILAQELKCELIVVKHIIFGEILFYNNFFIFKSNKDEENKKNILNNYEKNIKYIFSSGIKEIQFLDKIIIISYEDIEEIFLRYFAYIPQAIEIFLKNGKSYIFNFFNQNNLKLFIDTISSNSKLYNYNIIKEPKKQFETLNLTKKWEKNEISNYQYLLYLNKYSSRTYNDYNQYPIFPWVTLSKNYAPEKKIFSKKNTVIYRDMKYFMYTQTETGKEEALFSYQSSEHENSKNPVHFRLHYSTGGYILLYLMRISPFMEEHIRLQGGVFDNPGRMMHSIEEMLNIIRDYKDCREIIPEFFTSIEYFLNLNYVFFGQRSGTDQLVHNLIVPEINLSHKKLANFIYFNQLLLNNDLDDIYIGLKKCKIYHWINLVFGEKQFPKSLQNYNAFDKHSYRQLYSLENSLKNLRKKKLTEKEIITKMKSKLLYILYFGQCPVQMFDSKLKKKTNYNYNTNYKEYNLLNVTNVKVICFWLSNETDYEYIFFMVKHIKEKNVGILIYDKNMNYKSEINIGKIKLYNLENYLTKSNNNKIEEENPKLTREETFEKFTVLNKLKSKDIDYIELFELYYLNPSDAVLDFYDQYNIYLFIARNKDNTIKIFSNKNTLKGIIKLKNFVSVLHKKDKNIFFSGLSDGTLIEWELEYDKLLILKNILLKREIKAHNNCLITAINYNEKHNIILTSDINGFLFIRKYYDFEMLCKIKLDENNCFINKIFVNDYNFIYTINNNMNKFKKFICIYSLNGILIEKSKLHTIIDSYELKNGKIIFNRLKKTELFIFGFNNEIKEKDEALIVENIFNKFEIYEYDYINNFAIKDSNIYIILKNGKFIKGYYSNLDLVNYGVN